MKNIRLFLFSVFLFSVTSMFGQKAVDYEMKRQSFTVGVTLESDFFKKYTPYGVALDLGYDFRKLYEDHNFYMGIGPRLKAGWMAGDNNDYHELKWLDVSFNTFSWGASIAPSIGYELLYDPHFSLYLEGEVGVINYNTTAKLSEKYIELNDAKTKTNSTANLYTAVRVGARMNVASRTEFAIWVGMNNQNTDKMLDGLNLQERNLKDKKVYAEVGFGFGF